MKNKFLLFFLFSILLLPNTIWAQSPGRFIIEKISVEGNDKTETAVIFENLPFTNGDTVSESEIYSSIEQLKKINFFKNVTLQPRAGSETGKLLLIIQVEERHWPAIRFKGGISELDGWYITPVSLNMDNIFGRGNFLSINFTFGDRVSKLNLNYINPNIWDSDLDFYFDLRIKTQEFLHYIDDQDFLQVVPQSGIFLGVRSRSGFFKRLLFGIDLYTTTPDSFFKYPDSNEKFYNLPEQIARFSKDKYSTTAFSIYYDLDKRDQPYYPLRGWWIGAWFTEANVELEKSIKFTRLIFDVRKYQKLINNFVLAARLKAGGISSAAPFYEKFYLGGPNSLRGYDDRSLSPVGGGDQFLLTGLELRFPITQKNIPGQFLTGVLFFDSGANLVHEEALSKARFNGSYGFGLRFKLPFVRLLRVDFAYPVDKGESYIHISFGHTF